MLLSAAIGVNKATRMTIAPHLGRVLTNRASFSPSLRKQVLCHFSSSSGSTPEQHPEDSATVVQGPSLLTSTGVHRPSPSLFQLPGLRSLPMWTSPSPPSGEGVKSRRRIAYNDPFVSDVVQRLESNFSSIKAEYLDAVLGINSGFDDNEEDDQKRRKNPLEPDYDVNQKGGEHASDALHTGSWDWHSYLLQGEFNSKFASRCPKTASTVNELNKDGALFGTPFGFCFFSTLMGQSTIKPHTGPMNLRLRVHLPLIVPTTDGKNNGNERPKCGIRVGSKIHEWKEGEALVLDDSYEHEVWNDTNEPRVLLLVDIWHPDVSIIERERIGHMFEYAREKGWIGR